MQVNKVVSRHDLADVGEETMVPEGPSNVVEIEVQLNPDQTADIESENTDPANPTVEPSLEPLIMTPEDALRSITAENQKLVAHIESLEATSNGLKNTINSLENQIATGIKNGSTLLVYFHS